MLQAELQQTGAPCTATSLSQNRVGDWGEPQLQPWHEVEQSYLVDGGTLLQDRQYEAVAGRGVWPQGIQEPLQG